MTSDDDVLKDFFINVVRRCAIITLKWVERRYELKPYGSPKN
jgi:hypothetical protein